MILITSGQKKTVSACNLYIKIIFGNYFVTIKSVSKFIFMLLLLFQYHWIHRQYQLHSHQLLVFVLLVQELFLGAIPIVLRVIGGTMLLIIIMMIIIVIIMIVILGKHKSEHLICFNNVLLSILHTGSYKEHEK